MKVSSLILLSISTLFIALFKTISSIQNSGCNVSCSYSKCENSKDECLSKCDDKDEDCKNSCTAEYFICTQTRTTSCKMCITYCFYCENKCEDDYNCKLNCYAEDDKCLDNNNAFYSSKSLK